MSTLITGLFTDSKNAGEAIAQLKNKGYTEEISLVAKDDDGEITREEIKDDTGEDIMEGAGVGLLVGAVAGVVAAAIPGAPLAVAGPVAAAWGLTGGALGALTGGIAAGLMDLGFDETDANMYEEHIMKGDVMVGVEAEEDKTAEVVDIMEEHGVFQLLTVLDD